MTQHDFKALSEGHFDPPIAGNRTYLIEVIMESPSSLA